MKTRFRNNGLSIVMFLLFGLSILGQIGAGWAEHNREQVWRHEPTSGFGEYLHSGHFVEAVFENWESEFLQMGVYVALTAVLFQKGSPESRDPDEPNGEEGEEAVPTRRTGFGHWVYAHSLSIVLLSLFFVSFLLHAYGGMQEYNNDLKFFGRPAVTYGQFLLTPRFWFQSFQNWQSEFLSIGALVVLGIYLRQKGSSQSKPVDAPNSQTGS